MGRVSGVLVMGLFLPRHGRGGAFAFAGLVSGSPLSLVPRRGSLCGLFVPTVSVFWGPSWSGRGRERVPHQARNAELVFVICTVLFSVGGYKLEITGILIDAVFVGILVL